MTISPEVFPCHGFLSVLSIWCGFLEFWLDIARIRRFVGETGDGKSTPGFGTAQSGAKKTPHALQDSPSQIIRIASYRTSLAQSRGFKNSYNSASREPVAGR